MRRPPRAGVEAEEVAPRAALERVPPLAADQPVGADAAAQRVRAAQAREPVGDVVAHQRVGPRGRADHPLDAAVDVVLGTPRVAAAVEVVQNHPQARAAAEVEHVGAGVADEHLAACARRKVSSP
jgi:hypothetical protein